MVFNNSILLGAAGQGGVAPFDSTLISNSVWLDGSADGLTAPSSTFSAQDGKEFTLGTWFQLTEFGVTGALFCAGASPYTSLRHDSNNKIYFQTEAGSHILNTTAVFRDIGWYHILVSVDTTQSVDINRVKIYINGVEATLTGTYPAVNHAYDFNTAVVHEVGDSYENGAFEGYLAQSFMIGSKSIQQGDFGIADFLDTFTFGTNGSQFIPKKHSEIKTLVDTGSSNSFLLQYENSGALGTDSSTNTNTFTATDMGTANQSVSTPSKTYSVFNPLANADQALPATFTLSEGNQKIAINNSNTSVKMTLPFVMTGGNIIRTQFTFDSVGDIGVGITGSSHTAGTYHTASNSVAGRGEVAFFTNAGALGLVIDGNFNNPAFGGSDGLSNGDIVDVFVNCDVGAVYFAVNGTIKGGASQADIQNGVTTNAAQAGGSFVRRTAGEVFNFYAMQVNPSGGTITANTGQSAFTHSYSSITSLTSLNTVDLPAPEYQGIDYFDATLYEGNGKGQRVGDFVPFTDAYTVTNSVMFEDGDSRSLTLNSSATRTSATVAAFSLWTKRANLGTNQRPLTVQVDSNNYFSIYYNTSDQLDFTINNGGATILQRITTRVFKDNSAWHNIVVIINQGEGTQADRVKIFYDGVQISNDSTGFGTNTCTLDGSSALNFLDSASAVHDVGGGSSTGFTQAYDGYVSEVAFLDGADSGAKLNASDFGQVDTSTNRWVPKDIGSYNFGNTGYYLEFKVAPGTSNGAGTDTSGESNNFTSNGSWATTDQFTDTPSKNYPIVSTDTFGSATPTVTEGRLKVTGADNGGNPITMQPTSGKWYFEVELDTANAFYPGLVTAAGLAYTGAAPWSGQSFGFFYFTTNPNGAVGNAGTVVNGYNASGAMSSGDRLGIAWDVDNNLIYFGSASSGSTTFFSSGNPAAGTGAAPFDLPNERLYFVATHGGTDVSTYHFISSGWEGAAPTGFSELNQDNLDDTASKITAWAWIKNRDRAYPNAEDYVLVDRVRGIFKVIPSNETDAETTEPNTVQRFFQRGVQVGSETNVNRSGDSHVLWQWLVGDSATTGTSIGAGSISTGVPSLASTALVADAGHFAVINYTGNATSGATIGHGMSGAPEMLWVKERDNANGFVVSSTVIGFDKILPLDTTDDETGDAGAFNSTAPNANVITLGSNNGTNRDGTSNGNQMICYAFRSGPGVCKIGS